LEELSGKVAIVTGGASGIGFGLARAFAAEGMKIVVADIEEAAIAPAVKQLKEAGARAVGVRCDVADAASVEALRDQALAHFGGAHVLCNNAGVAGGAPAATWEASAEDWDWVMGINVMGVVHGIRSFIPAMIEQGQPAHIVNTASMAGVMPGAGIYGVTKHAVVALSESLFGELANRGADVGISVLCPGWVRTRIMESERNRPEAPRPDPGPAAEGAEMMRKVVSGLIERGLDPLDVGQLVVEAIRARRFYVLTHPHWKNMIQNRMENILEDRDPVGVAPPSDEWFPDTD
jgi:NAD(P)-dependent dehydrogenase (short-subunit alcohol dehydrogenase family)